jgi:hypothetical protein
VTVDLPGSGLADRLPDIPYYESHFVHWLEMLLGRNSTYPAALTGNLGNGSHIPAP